MPDEKKIAATADPKLDVEREEPRTLDLRRCPVCRRNVVGAACAGCGFALER